MHHTYFRSFVVFLLLLFAGGSLHAQHGLTTDRYRPRLWAYLMGFRFVGEAGITNCRPFQLNAAALNHQGFSALYTVGFGTSFTRESYNYNQLPKSGGFESLPDLRQRLVPGFEAGLAFHVFLPNKQPIVSADSSTMQYRLGGWELMTGAYALNLFRNEEFDVVIGYCTYWGNLKLGTTSLAGNTEYSNPFIAPALRTEVRFNIWNIGTGMRFSYRHDVTSNKWKSKGEDVQQIPGYRFREMQFMFYIGYYVIKRSKFSRHQQE